MSRNIGTMAGRRGEDRGRWPRVPWGEIETLWERRTPSVRYERTVEFARVVSNFLQIRKQMWPSVNFFFCSLFPPFLVQRPFATPHIHIEFGCREPGVVKLRQMIINKTRRL